MAPQGEPVTKARAFEPDELATAFSLIDQSNCYELVRGAVGAISYFGANRMAEIKELRMKGKVSNLLFHL